MEGTAITGSVQRTETEQSMVRFALPLESYVSTQHPSHNRSGANRIRPEHSFQVSLIDIYKDQLVTDRKSVLQKQARLTCSGNNYR